MKRLSNMTWPVSGPLTQLIADLFGDGSSSRTLAARGIPRNVQASSYTTVAADSGGEVCRPSTGSGSITYTIAHASHPDETPVSFRNQNAAALSITVNGGATLRRAGTGETGTFTLDQYGFATAVRVGSEWWITGVGLHT